MTIYIDGDYKCHLFDNGTRRAFDVPFFDGKCAEWIESYRYVPAGETWVESNGVMFHGEMVAPWKDLSDAYAAQAAYVTTQNKQYEAALTAIENALEVTT